MLGQHVGESVGAPDNGNQVASMQRGNCKLEKLLTFALQSKCIVRIRCKDASSLDAQVEAF